MDWSTSSQPQEWLRLVSPWSTLTVSPIPPHSRSVSSFITRNARESGAGRLRKKTARRSHCLRTTAIPHPTSPRQSDSGSGSLSLRTGNQRVLIPAKPRTRWPPEGQIEWPSGEPARLGSRVVQAVRMRYKSSPATSITGLMACGFAWVFSLGHPWGTLATVRDPADSLPSQKSRYFADSGTQETPRIVGDSRRTHS